jgi:hypothetical protein
MVVIIGQVVRSLRRVYLGSHNQETADMTLDHYKLLGRSGLRVSPMSLGTVTFGSA